MMTTAESEVLALLADVDPESRRRAALRIGELAGTEAVRLLARALGDADWRVRKEAAAVAPSVEPRAAVIECLFEALNDRENVGLRNAAVEALVALGRDAIPRAVHALGEADADARKLLVELLAGIPDLASTRALARTLHDADVNVRTTAAEALGTAGLAGEEARTLAVDALTSALGASEPLLRLGALNALLQLEARLAWAVFEPLTRDPLLRRHAIAAAGRSREPAAVAALAIATGDGSTAVAREALVALIECLASGPPSDELRAVAREEILGSASSMARIRNFARASDDSRVHGAALVALGLLRVPSDVPLLVRGLAVGGVAEQAELALIWFGGEAVSLLVAEARASSSTVRAAALALVPLLASRADDATLEALREALEAPTADVLTAALQALAAVGRGADLAFVAPHATSPDLRVAATAAAALTTLAGRYPAEARALALTVAPDAKGAVVGCLLRGSRGHSDAARADADAEIAADISFLRGTLDHRDPQVRRAAVDALAAIGGPTAAVVVARALADEERDVVLAAVRALGRIGQAEPLLALLEGVRDAVVVAAALRALGEASPEQAFLAARPLLRSDDPRLASSAVEAIAQLRGEQRDDGLFAALEHAHSDVVKTALVELSRDMSARTLARVGLCLDHPSYEVRRFASELLVSHDDADAHALVRARLDRETDPVMREALTLALALAPRAFRGDT
jgi:HEAT repeat protein